MRLDWGHLLGLTIGSSWDPIYLYISALLWSRSLCCWIIQLISSTRCTNRPWTRSAMASDLLLHLLLNRLFLLLCHILMSVWHFSWVWLGWITSPWSLGLRFVINSWKDVWWQFIVWCWSECIGIARLEVLVVAIAHIYIDDLFKLGCWCIYLAYGYLLVAFIAITLWWTVALISFVHLMINESCNVIAITKRLEFILASTPWSFDIDRRLASLSNIRLSFYDFSDWVLINCCLDSLDHLLFPHIEFTCFWYEKPSSVSSEWLCKLFWEGEYFLV